MVRLATGVEGAVLVHGGYDGVEIFFDVFEKDGGMGGGWFFAFARFWGGKGICLSGFGVAVLEQGPWEIGVTVYGYAVVMGIWMSAEECIERFKIFDH